MICYDICIVVDVVGAMKVCHEYKDKPKRIEIPWNSRYDFT